MRRIVLLFCLALVLHVPTALASHRGTPSIQGLATEAGLNLTLTHEGTGSSSDTGTWEGRHSRGETSYDFSYSFAWNATVRLTAPVRATVESPDLEGVAEVTFSLTGNERETRRAEGYTGWEWQRDPDEASACSMRDGGRRMVPVRAVFLPERGSFLVVFQSLGYSLAARWSCDGDLQGGLDGEPLATDAFAPDALALRALINRTTAARLGIGLSEWGADADADLEWMKLHAIAEIPLAFVPVFKERERTLTVPVLEPDRDRGRYCIDPSVNEIEATCRWSSTADWEISLDMCPPIRTSFVEHMDLLRAYPAADASRGLAALLAWKNGVAARISDVLTDARMIAIYCGGEDGLGDGLGLIAARTLEYQRALLELFAKGDRSVELVREVIGAERQLQLMGYEGDSGSGQVLEYALTAAAPPPAGEVKVSVHSPVSIHAWTENGAHVGWNATADALEVGIPGATYEGRPGEAQTITLPAGVYRVAVDELSPGTYALDVSWRADGSIGSEVFPLDARDGRSFVTHYALVADQGGAAFERYPVARVETPASFAFLDAPLRPVPDLADIRTPPAPTAPAPQAQTASAPVPLGTLGVVVALAGGSLVSSRRARR